MRIFGMSGKIRSVVTTYAALSWITTLKDSSSHSASVGLPRSIGRFLTGAYCSPAAYGVATSSNDLCPFCKMVAGHSAHTFWVCTHMCEGRPRRPAEAVQARLGWPRGLQPSYDEAVLAWMVRVRKAVLSHRYGDVT